MDVENYGIKLTLDGLAQATQQLDALGAKGEQSARRVTASFGDASKQMTASARAAQQMGVSLEQVAAAANGDVAAMRALAAATGQATVATQSQTAALVEQQAATRFVAPAVSGFRQLADVQEQAGRAAGVHGLNLGRINMELGTAIGRFSGVNTAATRFGAQLGGALAGYSQMIAFVGALVLIAEAYKAWTEEANKAKEAQDKLSESLLKWYDTQRLGAAGEFPKQIEALTTKLKALREELEKLNSGSVGGIGSIGAGGSKFDAWLRILTAGSPTQMVQQFGVETAKAIATTTTAITTSQKAIAAGQDEVNKRLGDEIVKQAQAEWRQLTYDMEQAALKAAEFDAASDKILKHIHDQGVEIAALNAGLVGYASSIAYIVANAAALEKQVTAIGAHNTGAAAGGLDSSAQTAQRQILRDAQDQARAIRESVNAAVDLAEAFNLVGRSMANVLASLGQIAASIQPLVEQIKALHVPDGQGGSLGSKLGVIGASLPIVGGIVSLTQSLFGGSEAARQRKQAEDQLRDSLTQSLAKLRVQMGQLSELAGQIVDAQAQFAARAQQINDAYAGKKNQTEREQLLAQNSTLEQQYIEWLKKQAEATKEATQAAKDAANETSRQNSHLRLLNATGQSDAAFQYQQSLELEKAIADGLSGIALSELIQAQWAEAAQREREKQTQILQDQLTSAQQAVDALQQVYDSLDQFSKSLNIGQYSPLSPRQKLDATRGQLGALYQAALGGDQQAAGQFSGVAQQFLDASRKYNASGAGYVLDFNSVSVMVDALKSKFGAQLTDAQKQVSLLQQQLDALKSIDNGIQTLVNRPGLVPQVPTPTPVGGGGGLLQPIVGITADAQVSAAGFQIVADKLDALTDAVESGNNTTRRSIDSLTSATLKAS